MSERPTPDPNEPPAGEDELALSEAVERIQKAEGSAPELDHAKEGEEPGTEPQDGPRLPGPAATPRPRPLAVPHHVPPAVAPAAPPARPGAASPYAPPLPAEPPRAAPPRPYGTPPRVTPPSAFAPPPPPQTLEEWAGKIPVAPPDPSTVRLQLPPHRNKLQRVSDHVNGIVDDVKVLTQLSADYVQAQVATAKAKVHEVQQRVENFQYQLETKWLLGVLALCALLLFVLMAAFGMSALAEKLFFDGRYLVSLMVGFATTAVLLIVIGVVHMMYMQRKIRLDKQARADYGKAKARQEAHEAESEASE